MQDSRAGKSPRPLRLHRPVGISPYGESNSGKECIKVALPQYILDRIRAEEEENKRLEAEKDEDKRLEAESKESVGKQSGPCSLLDHR
jgi:hypothetical protein